MEKYKENIIEIEKEIVSLNDSPNTLKDAEEFLNICLPILEDVKSNIGEKDEKYLKITRSIVESSCKKIELSISTLLRVYKELEKNAKNLSAYSSVNDMMKPHKSEMSRRFTEADHLLSKIQGVEMSEETKNILSHSKDLLSQYKSEIENSNDQKGGCYIATMAYGDYDHPQVMELRRFRDETLRKALVGRGFIRLYYRFSPILVEKLGNKENINRIIRKGLNQFIKTIKK